MRMPTYPIFTIGTVMSPLSHEQPVGWTARMTERMGAGDQNRTDSPAPH